VTTSASPSAFLDENRIRQRMAQADKRARRNLLLVPVQLPEFNQSSFLIPKLVRIDGRFRSFEDLLVYDLSSFGGFNPEGFGLCE
jgi:hypothetical protein